MAEGKFLRARLPNPTIEKPPLLLTSIVNWLHTLYNQIINLKFILNKIIHPVNDYLDIEKKLS